MPTSTFKFLQFSDVLLDGKLTGNLVSPYGIISTGFSLPKAERQERAREILEATVNAFAIAKQENVDAVFIPGGLWDNETISGYTVNTVIESVATLGDIPVYIAPGLTDYHTRSSLYSNDMLQARGLRSWPANVHIFSSEHFASLVHPKRGDVAIVGRAITKGSRRSERVLSGKLPRQANCAMNIAILAGTLESHPQASMAATAGGPGKKAAQPSLVYPFSEAEMLAQNMTYFAFGHVPEPHQITAEGSDKVIGGYAGALASGTFDKLGPRYALLGEISCDSNGECAVALNPIEIDQRRMMLISVDVSGLGDDIIKEEIMVNIEDGGVRPDLDVVALSLEGGFKPGANPLAVAEELAQTFYCMQIVDNTRPDYLAERFDERTTEWKYIQAMLDMKTKAERMSETASPQDSLSGLPGTDISGKTVEDALYYGLDALRQKRVTVRNVG